MTRLRFHAGVIAAVAIAVSCGVPVDREPAALPEDSLPPGLSSTTTTTAIEPEPDGVEVDFFLIGEDGKLEPVKRTVPLPVATQVVIETLIAAGDDEELVQEQQLRSAIPTRTIVLGVENPDGILTVNLGPEGLFELEEAGNQGGCLCAQIAGARSRHLL